MEASKILRFLHAIDDELAKTQSPDQPFVLHLIGRSVLILSFNADFATQDVDFVSRIGPLDVEEKLLNLFGKGTENAIELGVYLESVPQGIPPVPIGYGTHATLLEGAWKVLRPMLPEPHDLAVTKLKRFHRKDQADLLYLCEKGCLTPEGLERSLDLAYVFAGDEEEDPGRKRSYQNLRKVIDFLEGRANSL